MVKGDDYRLYLEERFNSLTVSMNAQFLEVHERLDDIKNQTTKTNGNVHEVEQGLSNLKIELITHAKDCPRGNDIEQIKSDLEDYRFFKRYPKLALLLITTFVIGLLFTIYVSVKSIKQEDFSEKVYKELQDIKKVEQPN